MRWRNLVTSAPAGDDNMIGHCKFKIL